MKAPLLLFLLLACSTSEPPPVVQVSLGEAAEPAEPAVAPAEPPIVLPRPQPRQDSRSAQDDNDHPETLRLPPARPDSAESDDEDQDEVDDHPPTLRLPPERPDVPEDGDPEADEAASLEPEAAPLTKPDLRSPKARACQDHSDCVISCAMDCCGAPCGCKTAVARAMLPAIEAWGRRDCPPATECPPVACRRVDAMGALCDDGVCKPRVGRF